MVLYCRRKAVTQCGEAAEATWDVAVPVNRTSVEWEVAARTAPPPIA